MTEPAAHLPATKATKGSTSPAVAPTALQCSLGGPEKDSPGDEGPEFFLEAGTRSIAGTEGGLLPRVGMPPLLEPVKINRLLVSALSVPSLDALFRPLRTSMLPVGPEIRPEVGPAELPRHALLCMVSSLVLKGRRYSKASSSSSASPRSSPLAIKAPGLGAAPSAGVRSSTPSAESSSSGKGNCSRNPNTNKRE